jgi:hypothetical protein
MAIEEDLRRLADEPSDSSDYSSVRLAEILLAHSGDINLAAAQIWTEKAALTSQLVDLQEGDTKRALSDLMDNALKMAKLCRDAANTGDTGRLPTTVSRIIRP